MEVSYKKDGNKNIMIIKDAEIDENDYKIQMVINNKIPGIVPINIESVNNRQEIHYEITSRTSMSNMLSGKKMTGKEIYCFIKEIKILSETLEEYLLDLGNIILDFEFIFFNRQTGKHEFCYIFYGEKGIHQNIRELFDTMLQYIDYNDKEAVLIGYGIQQITIHDDFTVGDIVNCAAEKIQEYKKQQEKEETVSEEMCAKEEEISGLNEENIKKKSWLRTLFDAMKKKNTYLSEEQLELKTGILSENEIKCYGEELLHQQREDGEINTGYLDIENDGQTMLLDKRTLSYGIILKSVNQEEPLTIIPDKFPFVIGKNTLKCDFIINSSVVSRIHLKILQDAEGYFVIDMDSTNGTFLNGKKLQANIPEKVNIGDKIMLANVEFIVE